MKQHFNQAAYLALAFGYDIDVKKLRKSKLRIINIKDIFSLSDTPSKKDILNIVNAKIKAEDIFFDDFILKHIEEENNINELEREFISLYKKNPIYDLFNKPSCLFETTIDFFSLHEARNIENYNLVKNELSIFKKNKRFYNTINNFIKRTYFFSASKDKHNIKILNDYIEKYLQEKGNTKEIEISIFNFLYPIFWKKKCAKLKTLTWFTAKHNVGFGLGGNIVKDMANPLYYDYKNHEIYKKFNNLEKTIVDELVFMYLGKGHFSIGVKNSHNELLIKMLKDKKFQEKIFQLLMLLSIGHSYKYIVIENNEHLNILIETIKFDHKGFVQQMSSVSHLFNYSI